MGKEGVGWGRLSVRSEWPFGGRRWQRGSLFSVFSRLTFHSASMGWLASNFQLTSWESGALTGRCLQNAKHLGGQGGGSYSLFIASKETGEISIKIQVLKFDCFPRRDSYIFCFVILFRVCLVDSILRRGLSCVSPSPPTSFPIQVSTIPHHPPAPRGFLFNIQGSAKRHLPTEPTGVALVNINSAGSHPTSLFSNSLLFFLNVYHPEGDLSLQLCNQQAQGI